MSGTLRTSVAVAIAALCPVGLPAADPVQHINLPYPAKTPLVLQVNGFEQARERLGALIAAAVPEDAAKFNKQIDAGVKQLLDGRKLTAVPKAGRVFFVVQDFAKLGEDEPAVALFVPVTGYKAFRESFLTADELKTVEKAGDGVDSVKTNATGDEATVFLVDLKEYVAVTPDKGTADAYAAKFPRGSTAAMGPDVAATFLTSDVSLFVNMDAINDQYGEQIRGFKGLIDFAFNQAGMGGQIPGLTKKQLEGVKGVLAGLFQGVEDSRGLVVGLEFRPEGLNARLQARFAPDSVTAGALKAEAPAPLAEVGNFPRGLTSYSATKLGKKIGDAMKALGAEFAAAEDDDDGAEAIDKLLAALAKAGPGAAFAAAHPPGTAITVTPYRDAAGAAAATTKLYQTLEAGGRVAAVVLKDKPKVAEKAKSHRGFTFAEVRLTFDFDATVASLPDNVRESTVKTLKRAANEKTTLWVGTDGKVLASVAAKDWAAAGGLLDAYLDGKGTVGGEAGFKLTRKNLPAAANLLSMTETGEMIQTWVEQLKSLGDSMPGFPQVGSVKPVKGEPTYMGVAVTLKADTATLDGFLPTTALNVAKKMLMPLFKNIE